VTTIVKFSHVAQGPAASLLQARFYPLLREWLASSAGSESRNNIICAANGTIITSQLGVVHSPPNDQVGVVRATVLGQYSQ
jgi:hypothetical protein